MLTNLSLDLPFVPDFGEKPDSTLPLPDRVTALEEANRRLREENYRFMEAVKSIFDTLGREGALQIGDATIDGSPIGANSADTGKFTTLTITSGSTMPGATWTPTVTSQGGALGATSASGTYWDVDGYRNFEARINLTTVGSGTGVVKFTLPSTPIDNGTGCGVEANINGKMVSLAIANAVNTVNISMYDATSPIVANAQFQVSGRYKK